MSRILNEKIDETIQSLRESFQLGPTLCDVVKLLEKIKSAPDKIQGADRAEIEEHFLT